MKLKKADIDPARYMVLCNLIETLWFQRKDKDFYEVDFNNLAPFTSPQARKIASFIDDLYQPGGVQEHADKANMGLTSEW
jgi:hypothetical protein